MNWDLIWHLFCLCKEIWVVLQLNSCNSGLEKSEGAYINDGRLLRNLLLLDHSYAIIGILPIFDNRVLNHTYSVFGEKLELYYRIIYVFQGSWSQRKEKIMVGVLLETRYYSFSFELWKIANLKRFIKAKTPLVFKILVPKASKMFL